MSERTKFLIFAAPRTGSTYLVDFLHAVPETRCCAELFQKDRIVFRNHEPRDPRLADIAFRDANPVEFLRLLAEESPPCRRFGCKVVGLHALRPTPEFLNQIGRDRSWKKIYLWRDDLFEQAVSFLLAERHFGEDLWERTPEARRIEMSPQDLLARLHLLQREYLAIEAVLAAAHPEDVFSLDYRDLGEPATVGKLLRFLDVPGPLIDAATRAMAPGGEREFKPGPALAQRIKNFAEVRQFLLNSRYRRFVEPSG